VSVADFIRGYPRGQSFLPSLVQMLQIRKVGSNDSHAATFNAETSSHMARMIADIFSIDPLI